jgi:P-type E1-E2 ATPase
MALAFHRERLGSGVEAEYDGRKFRIGSALQADQADVLKSSATQQELVTRLVLFENEKPLAVMSLGDQMRPEAHRVIQQIRDQGLVVRLISGDSPLAVAHAAESLQIPRENLRAEVSPEDKAEALSKTPSSMMVGDGVNDALALTSASVGIAVRGGLEASVRASDVYLSRRGISQIPQLVIMGRETLRIIKRNFLISLIYNLVAAVAAVSGMITPLLAAVLMPMSAFAVFTSAILGTSRLRRALQEVSR